MKKQSGLFCHLGLHKDSLDLKKEIYFIFSLKILHYQGRFWWDTLRFQRLCTVSSPFHTDISMATLCALYWGQFRHQWWFSLHICLSKTPAHVLAAPGTVVWSSSTAVLAQFTSDWGPLKDSSPEHTKLVLCCCYLCWLFIVIHSFLPQSYFIVIHSFLPLSYFTAAFLEWLQNAVVNHNGPLQPTRGNPNPESFE